MSTFTGEETYLEAFVEQFTSSQFTYQLRRTLDLLRDLDATGQAEGRAAQELSHEFLGHVERKIRQTLQVVISSNEGDGEGPERKRPRRGVRVIPSEDTVATEDPPMMPTTEELLEYILQEEHHNTTYQRILELQQSCRQNAEEKVQIAQQAYELVDAQVQRLDHDLRAMEHLLQSTGDFPTGSGLAMAAKPNDLAACQVTPGISEWILAKVLHHDPSSGTFQLSDEDVESNKIFDLPDSQVVVLSPIDRLSKGDSIYAVYPDTTSFYPATVVQATKKSPVVLVHFVDDADELGITHDKAVPLQHIMLPPASV